MQTFLVFCLSLSWFKKIYVSARRINYLREKFSFSVYPSIFLNTIRDASWVEKFFISSTCWNFFLFPWHETADQLFVNLGNSVQTKNSAQNMQRLWTLFDISFERALMKRKLIRLFIYLVTSQNLILCKLIQVDKHGLNFLTMMSRQDKASRK